jgi:antitoxin component of RelBE/YafQ-DinJ toxin-antitoxin module
VSKAKASAFVHVRIDADTHQMAKVLAAKTGWTISEVIENAVLSYSQNWKS